ncbi:unnamed protein product, partial [Closterium sp. Naga37s-1]
MGTGGVRRRSAVNGAGGGGDDGSETDGQGGELPPAAVAVEGEASGDVADAADTRRQYGMYGDDVAEAAKGFEEPADAAHHRHLYAAHHRHLYAAHHRHLYAAHHRHLYAARGVVYQWLGDPALRAVRRRRVAPGEARGEGERVGARGELHLSRVAKERKRALLGRRYNTHRDELTIVSE